MFVITNNIMKRPVLLEDGKCTLPEHVMGG